MATNAVINENSDEKINNLFNNMRDGLKIASSVDNTTASNLTNETHDLQDQWNQSTNTKNTASQNKSEENIAPQNKTQNNRTTLIEKILNLCSKIMNFLTRIKKHLKTKVDNILTSLQEGMQYCSQLLLGKSNYKSNVINNAQQNNAASPPPPPPPPSVSTRSVDDAESQKITPTLFLQEIKNARQTLKSVESKRLNVPNPEDPKIMLKKTLARRRKGIEPEEHKPKTKSLADILGNAIDKDNSNNSSIKMKATVEEWNTSDEQDIQEPNRQLLDKVSKGQDPQKQPIADILTNNKKQKSYTERENAKKALNKSNQRIKGRS